MSGPPTSSTARSGPGPLEVVWFAATGVPVIVGALGAFVVRPTDSDLPALLPVGLLVAVAVAVTVAGVVVDRTLVATPPASATEALNRFRSATFVGIALGTSPALLGFTMAFAFGSPWLAVVGTAVAVAGLLRVRPTPARADRIDAGWARAGGEVSLRAAIAELPGGRP